MKLTRREAVLLAAGALAAPGVARAATDDEGVGSVGDIVNYGWATIAPDPRGEIEFEDSVYMNEVIETDAESAVVVQFADGSKLTIGENAKVVIDRYVYDPAGSNSEQVVTLTKGAFRFLSGSIPKEKVKLQTPTVTIGIRGTELIFDIADDGETEMSTVAGEADCTDGAGETLTVGAEQSVLVGSDRRFRGRVRRFRHRSRSVAVDEGLDGARRRWRIRKERKRRAQKRRRRRRNND
ncbi:MAG: FecR family protein [Alphaproteobacteria bacterium]|nr:FecR family protein [Alphaproteobacteria bacterium]